MLFVCLTLSVFPFVLSNTLKEVCYGGNYKLPREYAPPLFHGEVFFTSSNTGVKRLVSDAKGIKDTRFYSSNGIDLRIQHLTEQDSGVFSVSNPITHREENVITLKIKDCAEPRKVYYGSEFSLMIPTGAELLEFTPSNELDQVKVLWDHTGTKGGRGSATRDYWTLTDTTQEDNGYYKYRGKNNTFLGWRQLLVEENERHIDIDEGKDLHIDYHDIAAIRIITFQPLGSQTNYVLIEDGTEQWGVKHFQGRFSFQGTSIAIMTVEYEDSGTYEFLDSKHFVALRVEVEVINGFPAPLYYVIGAGSIFLVVGICCCIKKCCCKKSSSKRSNPAPQSEAAPAVYYHDTTQPRGPSQSTTTPAPVYSYQPTSNTDDPPVAAPGGQGPTPFLSNGSDFISSDSDPQFVMKGISFASAPLFNSDTTTSDVYTSDKLNFL